MTAAAVAPRRSQPGPMPSAARYEDRLGPLSDYVEVKGSRIRYAVAGSGETILLCHGIPLSMATWQDLFFLLSQNYRVVAVDMPGYGMSSKQGADYSLGAISDTLAALCAALGAERIHAAGSSFGAAVAITLALSHPGLVQRLVLINSVGVAGGTHSIERLVRSVLVRSLASRILLQRGLGRRIFRTKLRASYASLVPDEALIDHYYALLLRDHGERSFLRTLQLFDEPALQSRLPQLRHPVLSIWGDKDKVLPLAKSLTVQRLLPRCWSTIIADAGHLPHEERPQECAERMEAFLRMPIV